MVIRRITALIAALSTVLCMNARAATFEIREWQLSETDDFEIYEIVGFEDELLITKDMFGKYVRCSYTDKNGNTSISDVKGPIVFNETKTVSKSADFTDKTNVTETVSDEGHYAKCESGVLYLKNSNGTGAQKATVSFDSGSAGKALLCMTIGVNSGHSRMKVFIKNNVGKNIFTFFALMRNDKLVLTDTTNSQLSEALCQTDYGELMRVELEFDFESMTVSVRNAAGSDGEFSDAVEIAITDAGLDSVVFSNEYVTCDAAVSCMSLNCSYTEKSVYIYGYKRNSNTVVASVLNFGSDKVNVYAVAAFYRDEKLCDVKINKLSVDSREFTFFESDAAFDSYKLFVVDDIKSLMPVSNTY